MSEAGWLVNESWTCRIIMAIINGCWTRQAWASSLKFTWLEIICPGVTGFRWRCGRGWCRCCSRWCSRRYLVLHDVVCRGWCFTFSLWNKRWSKTCWSLLLTIFPLIFILAILFFLIILLLLVIPIHMTWCNIIFLILFLLFFCVKRCEWFITHVRRRWCWSLMMCSSVHHSDPLMFFKTIWCRSRCSSRICWCQQF